MDVRETASTAMNRTAQMLRSTGLLLSLTALGVIAGCGSGDDATPAGTVASAGTSTGTSTGTGTSTTITVTPPPAGTSTTVTPPGGSTSTTVTPPGGSTTGTVTTTPDCSTVTPSTPGIVDGCGTITAAAYRAMATELGADQGIAYRYGASGACSAADGKVLPTWSHPQDLVNPNYGHGSWTYELGGPISAQGDTRLDNYYDNMGQAIYVPDASDNPGVVQLMTVVYGQNTFSEMPQIPWLYGGGGDPDINIVEYQKLTTLLKPIAAGRCYGYFSWCSNSIIVWPNGFIGTAGSFTARNLNHLQLPAGKVPTAVTVTNSGEFALITIWDTVNLKGQVAVIALGGTQGFWGDWGYPGLPNLGNISFMKLLGFVDLPGMMAPTEISAAGDHIPTYDLESGWYCTPDSGVGQTCRNFASNLSLDVKANRNSFMDDDPDNSNRPNADTYSRSGFAVVISKTEKKAIFLDLKPLFEKMRSMYFTTDANYAQTTNVGQADAQWPFAFSVSPDYAPKVITSLSFANAPTAVRVSLMTLNRAWIATIDGTLHFIDVGGYGSNAAALPTDIKEVGTAAIGKNTTSLAYIKHDPVDNSGTTHWIQKGLIATSRGECKIDWLNFTSDNNGATVRRTLQDSRLVDPIASEDNDAGGESYVLTVADYGGRQISNYRYGPVFFGLDPQPGDSVMVGCRKPLGCPVGTNGTDPFEFGGAYTTRGKPFMWTGSNTP